jgi:hypothetical protein
MNQAHEDETTVKVSKEAMKTLANKALPFESRKSCIERVIMQSCNPSKISETLQEQTESEDNE